MMNEEEIEFYRKMNNGNMAGLGDWISKNITEPLGVKKILTSLGIEDCGCEKRQEFLNEKFPFNKKD